MFYGIFIDHSGLLLDDVEAEPALFMLWQKRNAFAGLLKTDQQSPWRNPLWRKA
jgi:hypothetical protein